MPFAGLPDVLGDGAVDIFHTLAWCGDDAGSDPFIKVAEEAWGPLF